MPNALRKAYQSAMGNPQLKAGYVDPSTGAMRTKPWSGRKDSIYLGMNGDVWVYRVLRNQPLVYEDNSAKLKHGADLQLLLAEIGRTSTSIPAFFRNPDEFYREIHVISIRWETLPKPPEGTPNEALRRYLKEEVLLYEAPAQAVFVGVKLFPGSVEGRQRDSTVFGFASDFISDLFDDRPPGYDVFEPDKQSIIPILQRNNCRKPTREEEKQLEAWFNRGAHAEPMIVKTPDHLLVRDVGGQDNRVEFAAVEEMNEKKVHAPHYEWLSAVLDMPDGPSCISIRGHLQPPTDLRRSFRRNIRLRRRADEARQETNQDDRADEEEVSYRLQEVERLYSFTDAEATLKDVSIVFGREDRGRMSEQPWYVQLRNLYNIETNPLMERQIQALNEVQPCSVVRTSPNPRHMNLEAVAYAGLASFAEVGDESGAHAGRALPDGSPSYFNFLKSSEDNQPPVTFIAGVPGSGKTMLAQWLGFQAALGGLRVSLVNPKGGDSLSSLLPYMEEHGISTEHVRMSRLFSDGGEGTYDPFRYTDQPEIAAMTATNFIITIMDDFNRSQRTAIGAGMMAAARDGVRCVGDALQKYVKDQGVAQEVIEQRNASPYMALCIGMEARGKLVGLDDEEGSRIQGQPGHYVLTEFDVELGLPSQLKETYSDPERIALATVQAVVTANIQMLRGVEGGAFIMDEAHHILGHPTTVNLVKRMMRESRSLNVAQIYISQLISDLVSAGTVNSSLESFISRAFALNMTSDTEATAALELIGYEPTRERIDGMSSFKPGEGSPALGYARDLSGRKSPIQFDPLPPKFMQAASTNIKDRRARGE